MNAGKMAMLRAPSLFVPMHARVQRLGRRSEGKPVLARRCSEQGAPEGVRVDGCGDWAPRRGTAAEVHQRWSCEVGDHAWGCDSVAQSTVALGSGESEMYAVGSVAAGGPQCKAHFTETLWPRNLNIYSG